METKQSKQPRQSIWIWDEDYPYSLTTEELKDPSLALQDVFKHYSLTDCQYLLWEWKHCHYRPYLFSFGNGLHTLYHLMCKLKKLINVAWLIDNDFVCSQLLTPCSEISFEKFSSNNYCIFLGGTKNSLKTTITQLFNEEDGLQGFMNVMRHWWDLGIDWRHLDVGDRCQVGNEIPEFRRIISIIEITNFIYKCNSMEEQTSLYAHTAYLSLEEARDPVKTLMKILSKWEYEDLKKLIRDLFYILDISGGFEAGVMGNFGGIVHTCHKLVALAQQLSSRDASYFEEEKNFTLNDYSDLGNFWTDYDNPPFHHLSQTNLPFLIEHLKVIDYEAIHRDLHGYIHMIESDEKYITYDRRKIIPLFQALEKLMETLYLLVLNRIQTDW